MSLDLVLQAGLLRRRRGHLFWWLAGLVLVGFVAASCGSDGRSDEAFVDTYDTYFQSFSSDYNPSPDLEDLSKRSTVVVEATLVDVEDGPFVDNLDPTAKGTHLNLVFDADDGTRYYVELPRPTDSTVEQLRSVLPIGARSVVYLQPNNDPRGAKWFNRREDGNEWFFTTPQGWILDHLKRGIVFPLAAADGESPFLNTPVPTEEDTLADWLVGEKQGPKQG